MQTSPTTSPLPSDASTTNPKIPSPDQVAPVNGLSQKEEAETSNSNSIAPVSTEYNADDSTSGKPSHDSGFEQVSDSRLTPPGATTPASRTSMDASSDLFHGTNIKVDGAEMRNPGRRSPADTVPAPLTTPIPSAPPIEPTFKSRMSANLALHAVSGNGIRELPAPSQSSPLRQSTTFQQEQLSQLKLDDGKRGEVEVLISPSEGGSTIPRSISLPVTSIKDSPLPPTPRRYADADESTLPMEESAFPVLSSHEEVKGLSRNNSNSSHLADIASVSSTRLSSIDMLRSLSLQPRKADYVIAVVGAEQVGKSTIIGKAFKAWGLSEPVSLHTEGDPPAPQSELETWISPAMSKLSAFCSQSLYSSG